MKPEYKFGCWNGIFLQQLKLLAIEIQIYCIFYTNVALKRLYNFTPKLYKPYNMRQGNALSLQKRLYCIFLQRRCTKTSVRLHNHFFIQRLKPSAIEFYLQLQWINHAPNSFSIAEGFSRRIIDY